MPLIEYSKWIYWYIGPHLLLKLLFRCKCSVSSDQNRAILSNRPVALPVTIAEQLLFCVVHTAQSFVLLAMFCSSLALSQSAFSQQGRIGLWTFLFKMSFFNICSAYFLLVCLFIWELFILFSHPFLCITILFLPFFWLLVALADSHTYCSFALIVYITKLLPFTAQLALEANSTVGACDAWSYLARHWLLPTEWVWWLYGCATWEQKREKGVMSRGGAVDTCCEAPYSA